MDIMASMQFPEPAVSQSKTSTRVIILRIGLLLATGILLGIWLVKTPAGIQGKADAIGYAVCHQIPERSFHIHARPASMCARCMGMYMGVILGLAYFLIRKRHRYMQFPDRLILVAMVLLSLIWAADSVNSYLHLFPFFPGLYAPSNVYRTLTGTILGVNMAIILVVGMNQTTWKTATDKPIITNLGDYLLLVSGTMAINCLLFLDLAAITLVFSLLSAFTVLLVLGMVYSMAVILLLKHDDRIHSWQTLKWYYLAGFLVALLQVGVLDWIRILITGTWSGFVF